VSANSDIGASGPGPERRQSRSRREPHANRLSPLQPTQAGFEPLKIEAIDDLVTTFAACPRGLPTVRRPTGLKRGGSIWIEKMLS
jgi:hypothetical protein